MSFADDMARKGAQINHEPQRTGPVWEGPESDGPNGGITFSLLSRFLVCRERFRVYAVEGLTTDGGWNHRLGYGDFWHICEEAHAGKEPDSWMRCLTAQARKAAQAHPTQAKEILHWYNVCTGQFPVYVDYWKNHPEIQERQSLLSEYSFRIPYTLPSNRVVYLRGKFDSVDLVGKGKSRGVWLQENKSKGDIRADRIAQQLTFDLQTMLYLTALRQYQLDSFWRRANKMWRDLPIMGVRYNVVRRPLSGGRHTIKQHEPRGSKPGETTEAFYARLQGLIESEPEYFFMRWNVPVTEGDITRFRQRCLDPILEELCQWWDHVSRCQDDPQLSIWDQAGSGVGLHYQRPYGVYNALDEGGSTDLDSYLESGSTVGLHRVETLFPELT